MSIPTVTYTIDYYQHNFVDFFGGALSLYAHVRDKAHFQIWIPRSLPIAACFDFTCTAFTCTAMPSPKHILLDPVIVENSAPQNSQQMSNQVLSSLTEDITVTANIVKFVPSDALRAAVPGFLRLFKTTAAVNSRRAELLEYAGVTGPYLMLCASNCYCSMAFVQILTFMCDLKEDLPIIFQTDNTALRNRVATCIPELHILGGGVQQTANCIDTVAEFYIIGGAQKIYYITDNDFTRLSALLFGVEQQQI